MRQRQRIHLPFCMRIKNPVSPATRRVDLLRLMLLRKIAPPVTAFHHLRSSRHSATFPSRYRVKAATLAPQRLVLGPIPIKALQLDLTLITRRVLEAATMLGRTVRLVTTLPMRELQHSPSTIALQRRIFVFLVTTMMDRGNMLVTMPSSCRPLEIASVAIRTLIEMQLETLIRTVIDAWICLRRFRTEVQRRLSAL